MHYEMGNPFDVTHSVEQTCSTDYHTVFRSAEEGQISGFDPLQRKIRCRSARKKAQILKISTSRRRYVQKPGNSVSVSIRLKVPDRCGGLTFGPKPGAIDKGKACFS